MKKITLVCCGGYSTSLLLTKMDEAAAKKDIDVLIRAVAESRFEEYENDTDVLLIGPQLEYLFEDLKEKYEPKGIAVAVISGADYGIMNGEKVLNDALNLLEFKK